MTRPTLDELALKYGTDKSSKYHGYTHVYEGLFETLRDSSLSVLELGWGAPKDPNSGGASAMMWRDYFPNSKISVVDIQKNNLDERHDGINFYEGSQDDPLLIEKISSIHGPFDIIVDDASHISSLTIASWELLYPHLNDGGIYVYEDAHSSFVPSFYGDNEANQNPYEFTSTGDPTAFQYFQRLALDTNCRGRHPKFDLFPVEYSMGYDIKSVTFLYNLVIVGKYAKEDPYKLGR